MTINQKIRKIREDLGLTQSQFAEIVGTTDKTISRWEQPNSSVPYYAQKKIAEALNLSTFEIFDDDVIDGFKIDSDDKIIERIKNLYAQLPADKKLEVLKSIIDGK